jgi:DNA polymerase I-like protein with 3'-5' exonuclease and polymerase domains
MRARWLASAPEYEQGWKDSLETFNSKGYLREPIWGRRRDFLDSILEVQPNEIVNYSIQSSAAAIVNQAMIQIIEQIPMFKWGPGTGLVCNVHDFLMVECPADGVTFDGEGKPIGPKDAIPFQVAAIIEEAMNLTHPALPGVKLTASAGIAKEWKNV